MSDLIVPRVPPRPPSADYASGWYAAASRYRLLAARATDRLLAMDSVMRLPMKVSATTSNFMIGVTAAASAGIYFARGDINPTVAAPVALGVLLGATIGARTLARLSITTIRKLFLPLLGLIAIEMLIRGGAMLLASVH
jgi:sulfite exporter TauE/SafE